ncbi:conserved hypothetical protein [Histoplasma capsulatum G186AR]|uniref:Mediator of RNA polymerase II transcription subunit 9 n=1 Tax=Ajellomyces capsulatus (strain G186AR / H82 / ATCC MYA-2454 / RMSCC 2432) TaxID=447093 RepID=C0NGS4_AJECG|nr:uncharacterized protein HCBG_02546 [Histoplasma capsulatum G186AR]EEH09009.1 conserved hypothetical protein [Histoplasma capsulatum G186AR]
MTSSVSMPGIKVVSSLQSATNTSSPATPGVPQQLQVQSQTQHQPQQEDQQGIPQPAPFPPPQTFDILPSLHDLLLRLASSSSNPHQHQTDPTSAGDNDGPSSAIGGPGTGPGVAANTTAARPTSVDAAAVAFLDPKLLLSEASAVKIRIQKAKAALESLPDIQRGVAEQEDEIRVLEERIERLKGIIVEFGKRSTGFAGVPGMG